MKKNIFIIGPVASGKNTLLEKIIEKNPEMLSIDTGKIYRYISFKIYQKLNTEISINKILNNDKDEISSLLQKVYHLTNYYSNALLQLKIVNGELYENEMKIDDNKLYCKETNAILPIIAKVPTLRNRITSCINDHFSNLDVPIIMTGHNIKEIDTTKFIVVYLDVNEKQSAYRLYNRNKDSYESVLDAYDEVIKRNSVDNIKNTKKNLNYLYQLIVINTDDKNIEDIYKEFMTEEEKIEKKEDIFKELQSASISREKFEWIFNLALQPLKLTLEELGDAITKKHPYINKNDLIYQTLILLTAYKMNDLYFISSEYAKELEKGIKFRDKSLLNDFSDIVRKNKKIINYNLLHKVLEHATHFLNELYKDEEVQKIMINYNKINNNFTLKASDGLMIKSKNGIEQEDKIKFKKLDLNTSKFISKYCHYLHTPREDELVSYGAFLNDEDLPIAYVSYSRQDRDYKKQLLNNIGIEPQNTLEMTRAWCSNYAPSNIMSALFQFSIDDISNNWKQKCKSGAEDKYLQAVTTTINPNLGFKASSFLGCNFIPIALRPAGFTFAKKDDIIEYNTRRKISADNNSTYFENQLEILPLNELILCVDKNKQSNIKNNNILLIDKTNYDKVLSEINKEKRSMSEKNINSYKKQR